MEHDHRRSRADWFHYSGLEVTANTLRAHFDLDARHFVEEVTFEGVGTLERGDVLAVAQLWYLIAGLSYYKAGAARALDLGTTSVGAAGRQLLVASLIDGLGEYSYRNDLDLSDVSITGGLDARAVELDVDADRVLTPFGGGIDSVVTVTSLSPRLDQALFIMSPPDGRFEPLEATARVTGLPIRRATRTLDPQIRAKDPAFFNGHVPVSAMITLLAVVAAIADGRGGVVMSNEHSASVPNLQWHGRAVNHQWSKSLEAEELLSAAVAERLGSNFTVASFLRDRSELWVAQQFAQLPQYHSTFRSCNRAFAQDREARATTWCGECDKCLFIDLVLAPFLERGQLRAILGSEPLSDSSRAQQLTTLIGLGELRKPFECVGDPTECAVALRAVVASGDWNEELSLIELSSRVTSGETLDDLLTPQGVSRVPASWLR